MSSVSKATRELRAREFSDITSASPSEASRFLKVHSYNLESAINGFYSDPSAMRAAELYSQQMSGKSSSGSGASIIKNLDNMWNKYKDPKNSAEAGMNGTLQYCEDLEVDPEDVVMLAVAWLTKAPTMGKFAKKEWIEGWTSLRKDTIELQKDHIIRLRADLKDSDIFRKVYNFSFDYAKTEGQRSMQLDIATELWNLLIPLDPIGHFSSEHLNWWLEFLILKGSKAVSKDTWNLFLEFTRGVDPTFSKHDEEAAWPSLIDDFVDYAREKISTSTTKLS